MPRSDHRTAARRDSLDDVEMQEREDSSDQGSEERLLPDESESKADVAKRTVWRLRTGWKVLLSIAAAGSVFLAFILFTKYVIARDGSFNKEIGEIKGIGSFRRPTGDYVLDPAWDFDAPKQTREYKWTIVDRVANPDGVFRPMLMINGQFPGPMIECNQGDTLVIDVENQSTNATSVHWHGIFQNGTNFMDGTSGVTQCPIAPGRKFQYRFTVSGQHGTYYYHGHQAVQAADGLYGPLVIHSSQEKNAQKIPYASDRVIMVSDYYHDVSSGLLKTSLEPGNEGAPVPDGALLNGLNQRDCSKLPDRLCDNSTTVQPSLDLVPNASHRLRFINVGSLAWFQVSVDDHLLAVTEVDGTDINPATEPHLMISPAQRYSVILKTDQTSAMSFWIRARMVAHCWQEIELPMEGADVVTALLRYSGKAQPGTSTSQVTTTNSPSYAVECRDMNTTTYIPSIPEPAAQIADHSYYLRSNIEIGNWRLERGFFNTSTFRADLKNPTLHRTIDGFRTGNDSFEAMGFNDGVNAVAYDQKNDFLIQHSGVKVVDVIIQNFDEGSHPMHLHGHKFLVLGQGHGYFPGYEALGLKENGRGVIDGHEDRFNNLIRRDVAAVEGYGWLALRFVADNPGCWLFHCHMSWHSESGLAMQFLDRVDDVSRWEVPMANAQLCESPVEELEKGAMPKDSIWFGSGIGR